MWMQDLIQFSLAPSVRRVVRPGFIRQFGLSRDIEMSDDHFGRRP
jgi:hypothetical protein